MRRLCSALLAASLFAACGGTETEPSSESLASLQSPLTSTDVDVAPECQGILTFVNVATYAKLDEYLPSDVALNLVNRRATAPFVSLADVSSVSLVGPARLQQIAGGARTEGYIGTSCLGIMDDLAISMDDEAALVAVVNTVSSTELHDILPYAWNGATNLLNLRPFSSAQAISNMSGIGSVSFRNIRNASTLSLPLESLIAAVNGLPQGNYGGTMARHFDWYTTLMNVGYYRLNGMECFGIDPEILPYGATIRPNLATGSEVRSSFLNALSLLNRNNQIPSSVVGPGVANLDALTTGRSFKGCYVGYSNDPWSGNNLAFFVDTVSGFGVLTDTYWSE